MPLIIIKMAYAILVTSVVGTVFLLIWLLAGCLLKKAGYLNVANRMLRILPVFFVCPFPVLILDILNEQTGLWRGLLFLHTPILLIIARVILIVWGIVVAVMMMKYFLDRRHVNHMLMHATVCKKSTRGTFERIRKEFRISGNSVELLESYEIPSPALFRMKHPAVVISCEKYSEDELNAIFYHELTHYQHKDVLYMHALSVICVLNFFNPFVWMYRKIASEWMEQECDDCAQKAFGDVKRYAIAITEIASREARNRKIALGNSVSQKPLGRRIRHMLTYSKIKKKSKGFAALLVAAGILLSGTGTTAVVAATANQYVDLYNSTCVLVEENTVYEPGVEYVVEAGGLDGVIVEEGEVTIGESDGITRDSSVISFSWTISPLVLKKTPALYCTKGQGLQVSCMFSPTTQDVRLGILEPDGTKRFLQDSGAMMHTFSLTKTGYYYVFVENISSSVTMGADGSYRSVDQ